jgi:predicted ATPase
MIQRAWFEEFRALRKVSVELTPLTVFVGPNGSGKTSVLEGIELALLVAQMGGDVAARAWARDRARRAEAVRPTALGVEIEGGDPPDYFEVRYRQLSSAVPTGFAGVTRGRCGGVEKQLDEGQTFGFVNNLGSAFDSFKASLPRVRRLRLDASSLAAPSYSEDAVPLVSSTGEGLASVIADLASRRPDVNDRIVADVRRVIPSLRRIRAVRAQVERDEMQVIEFNGKSVRVPDKRSYWGHSLVVDMTGGDDIPLSMAGEGTALAVGLMTVLRTAEPPQLLLLDDLDRALHPKAQQDLVALLREVMAADPELQIIATSHSPFLLDALEHEEVRLTTLADDGGVLCAALHEHPEFEQWKSLVKPGELWTSGLEDWLRAKQGRAA